MGDVATSVVIKNKDMLVLGQDVIVMDFVILGLPNEYPDIFEREMDRRVILEDKVRIHPWALVYEGATLKRGVIMAERTCVGSLTTIGAQSRVLYHAQVHDHVTVGESSVVAAFVADNCRIGNRCSVFGSLVHSYSNPDPRDWDSGDEPGPTLEDDVVVGWGAVIIGPVRIGRAARIHPNAVVRQNIAAGETYG